MMYFPHSLLAFWKMISTKDEWFSLPRHILHGVNGRLCHEGFSFIRYDVLKPEEREGVEQKAKKKKKKPKENERKKSKRKNGRKFLNKVIFILCSNKTDGIMSYFR